MCIINRIISFVKRMIGMNGDDKHNKIPVPNALI
nr:lysozyme [Candidatus Liberibacter asiaticus]